MLNPAALVPLREAAMGLMEFLGSDYGPEFKGESERRYGAACRTMLTALTLAESPSPVGEVKRWEMVTTKEGFAITPDTAGSYVLHTDYAALSAELAEVRGVLAWMTSAAERISSMPQEGTSEPIARDLLRTAIGLCDDALKAANLHPAATVKGGK